MNKSFITIRPVLLFVKKKKKQHTKMNFKKKNSIMGNLNVINLHQPEAKNQLLLTFISKSG